MATYEDAASESADKVSKSGSKLFEAIANALQGEAAVPFAKISNIILALSYPFINNKFYKK